MDIICFPLEILFQFQIPHPLAISVSTHLSPQLHLPPLSFPTFHLYLSFCFLPIHLDGNAGRTKRMTWSANWAINAITQKQRRRQLREFDSALLLSPVHLKKQTKQNNIEHTTNRWSGVVMLKEITISRKKWHYLSTDLPNYSWIPIQRILSIINGNLFLPT